LSTPGGRRNTFWSGGKREGKWYKAKVVSIRERTAFSGERHSGKTSGESCNFGTERKRFPPGAKKKGGAKGRARKRKGKCLLKGNGMIILSIKTYLSSNACQRKRVFIGQKSKGNDGREYCWCRNTLHWPHGEKGRKAESGAELKMFQTKERRP